MLKHGSCYAIGSICMKARKPQSSRPLGIMDKLLTFNPTGDAFHAVRNQMQCAVH